MKDFGDKLKRIMLEKGLTQRELGKILGVYGSQVNGWCTNKKIPTITTVKKIAEALNIPISYFLGDDNSVQQNVIGDNAYNVSQNLGSDKSALEKDIEIIKLKLDLILEKIDKKG